MFSLRTSTELRFPVNRPLQTRLQCRRALSRRANWISFSVISAAETFRVRGCPPFGSQRAWLGPMVETWWVVFFHALLDDISNVCILSSGCPTGRFIFRRIRTGWTRLEWIGSLELKVFSDSWKSLWIFFRVFSRFLDNQIFGSKLWRTTLKSFFRMFLLSLRLFLLP